MPTFEITAPNGKKYRVEGPEGSTEEEALERVKAQLSASAVSTDKEDEEGGYFKDIPREIGKVYAENLKGAYEGLFARPFERAQKAATEPISIGGALRRTGADIADVGSGLLSVPMLIPPVAAGIGAGRSILGHGIQDVTNFFNRPEQQITYEKGKEQADLAMGALGRRAPRGAPQPLETFAPPPPPRQPSPVVPGEEPPRIRRTQAEAAEAEKEAERFGFKLSRGQAYNDLGQIREEDLASRGGYGPAAQDVAAPKFEEQYRGILAGGKERVGEPLARGEAVPETASEAAQTVNTDVLEAAERARAGVRAVENRAELEAIARRNRVEAERQALEGRVTEGRPPIGSPREAGEVVGEGVREAARRGREEYGGLYEEARGLPGQFERGALEGIGRRIQGRLTHADDPVIIDDVTTRVATSAINDLDNVSNLRIQNRADPRGAPNPDEIVAVDLRGVDQARKRLVRFYQAARASNNASDVRAMGRIIDEFDAQIEQAVANGLFSGDPRALEVLQAARDAYRRYAQTFRPQPNDGGVGNAIRQIIDRNATPEEVANMIHGTGRIGNSGLAVRLSERLEQILGRGSDEWNAVRQAIWQKAALPRNAAGEVDAVRAAQGIHDLATSSLGRRVFSDTERAAMVAHARGVRDLERSIAALPTTRGVEAARAGYESAFGGADIGGAPGTVFRRIVDGTATPEETANAVFNIINGGNPGNVARMIRAIQNIVGPDSATMAAIRQGVWQKLTQHAIGKDQPGQQKLVQSINEFVGKGGRGRSIAEALYTPEELDLMQGYANAVKMTVIPPRAATRSDTTVGVMSVIHNYATRIAGLIGVGIDQSLTGGLAGLGVGKVISEAAGKFTAETRAARKMRRQFQPVGAPPPPPRPPGKISAGIAASAPGRAVGTMSLPPFLQAEDRGDENKPKRAGQ